MILVFRTNAKLPSIGSSSCLLVCLTPVVAHDRLEVGSESGPDRSKSIKTYLMPLFEAAGNFAVEVRSAACNCFLFRHCPRR